MKALLVGLLAIVAACGEGRAIFNVDVHSFMVGTGKDTIPYVIPPFTSATASTFQKITLPPGFGSSGVDSVRISSGNINLVNAGGAGSIGFALFFAGDSLGTTTTTDTALTIPVTNVTPAQTFPVPIQGDLSSAVDSLFKQETVWIRIAATGTNGGATPVTGKGLITALQIRVVLQDKIF